MKKLLFALLVANSSLSALDCETWLAVGGGSRNDVSHFTGSGFILEKFEIEDEDFKVLSGPDFSFSSDVNYSIISGWVKTRADYAYFKLYGTYGELDDRSLHDLWAGIGYYGNLLCYRLSVIPNVGYTEHTHHVMEPYSYWTGLDLKWNFTPKWEIWGEFAYHFAFFRDKTKKGPFYFKERKGHAITARIGTDFHLYYGWFVGIAYDYQDWKSSDSHNIHWTIRDLTGHIGYYF